MMLTYGDLIAGRYSIDHAAGSGGMGTVYRALDRFSGEFVALKLLNSPETDGDGSERFAREAQLLSELQHPGIVSHIAHGLTPQGRRFLAMQWLEGEDLAQRLARGPLALSEALLLTERVAEALAFAHGRDILHRDLKPTNLFLQQGEIARVKLLDFGIARKLSTSRAITRTGMIVGTPEYMSPEQARGVRELTVAADIFSLGCVFYECLTGEPPFVAEHIAAVLVRILFEEPVPVAQRRPNLPAAVSELLNRMLTKDPAQRLTNAGDVATALAAIRESRDLPLLPTIAGPAKTTPAQTDSEQVLLSLVLAISPRDEEVGSPTLSSANVMAEQERYESLLAELRATGAQADLLLGGAMVVTVPQMPSAQDQATQAARYASMIKERWPEAQIVVVTGRGSRSRGGLTGEVLDRAWRLLGKEKARPSAPSTPSTQIRIDHVSAGLLQTRFVLTPLPAAEEGFVLGSEQLDADAARLLLGKPTPCLGRDRELATLEAMYDECKEELVSRAVLVLGPPGLGKSRLRHEFVRRLENRGAQGIVLVGRGDPMKVKSAYGILGEALRKRLDLREGQDTAEQRGRIRARISTILPASEVPRVAIFIGEICGVPFPDEESPQLRAARQDPRIMSDQVERAWLDALKLLRTEEPLLLILEDLHWSDALTVKLVGAALRRLRDHAFMVLALARPEVSELYPDLWSGAVQNLPLHPLPRKAGERLVRQILGADVGPAQIAQIVEQSAGNPLFLEELIRVAAERRTSELPETVVAMIQARIGRLPVGTRRALRAASVFGEMFWENGVWALLGATHGDDRAHSTLEDLVRVEIIEKIPEGRFVNETQYHFRHALVRDAAYGMVGEDEKIAWHAAAGKFLEDAGEREAIILADHYRLGKALACAVKCYARAAEQAYDASNTDAALVCVERGLVCGATGEDRGGLLSLQCMIKQWREEYDQILTVGREALTLLRPGSKLACQVLYPMAIATLILEPGRLLEVMTQLLHMEPEREALPGYYTSTTLLAAIYISAGQKGPADLLRQRAHQIREGLTEQDDNVKCHYSLMEGPYSHLIVKLPHTCILNFRNGVRAANDAGNRQVQVIIGGLLSKALTDAGQRNAEVLNMLRANLLLAEQTNDSFPLSYAHVYLARYLADSSNPDDWEEAKRLALLALQTKTPIPVGMAHRVLAQVALACGDLETAQLEVQTACQVHKKLPPYMADSVTLWSCILRAQGQNAEALKVCEDAMQQLNTLGIEPAGLLALYVELAEARECMGQPEPARQAIAQALPIFKRWSDDIPNSELRTNYQREVPENARLLALARQWGIATSALDPGA